jgi:hypothetical protein
VAALATFLAEAGRIPFSWGERDCLLFLADWVRVRHGVDPAAHLRGRYHTALGCRRILRREGGPLSVVSRCAAGVGLEPTDTPRSGDVGVVAALTERGIEAVGAICTGPRWAMLGTRGLLVGPAQPFAAWRV